MSALGGGLFVELRLRGDFSLAAVSDAEQEVLGGHWTELIRDVTLMAEDEQEAE